MNSHTASLPLTWKVGFEIELMAPTGFSRRDLAERIAKNMRGDVTRFFHPDSEPAKVEGTEIFENLTPGFRVSDTNGDWVASFVDDLTLQDGLNRGADPKSGWYRIVSDDNRIIRLIEEQCDAENSLKNVLNPLATLFGTKVETLEGQVMRVRDKTNISVALAVSLPGERERPCEVITAPIETDHEVILEALLRDAKALGFTIPKESATHIHFDAKPLRSTRFISNFVALVSRFGAELRVLMATNPACVRLGPYNTDIVQMVSSPRFMSQNWQQARENLSAIGLTKYCDYNLVNMINQSKDKDTLEIRILPGIIDAQKIVHCTRFFEAMMRCCLQDGFILPNSIQTLIQSLSLDKNEKDRWLAGCS